MVKKCNSSLSILCFFFAGWSIWWRKSQRCKKPFKVFSQVAMETHSKGSFTQATYWKCPRVQSRSHWSAAAEEERLGTWKSEAPDNRLYESITWMFESTEKWTIHKKWCTLSHWTQSEMRKVYLWNVPEKGVLDRLTNEIHRPLDKLRKKLIWLNEEDGNMLMV